MSCLQVLRPNAVLLLDSVVHITEHQKSVFDNMLFGSHSIHLTLVSSVWLSTLFCSFLQYNEVLSELIDRLQCLISQPESERKSIWSSSDMPLHSAFTSRIVFFFCRVANSKLVMVILVKLLSNYCSFKCIMVYCLEPQNLPYHSRYFQWYMKFNETQAGKDRRVHGLSGKIGH